MDHLVQLSGLVGPHTGLHGLFVAGGGSQNLARGSDPVFYV